MLEDAAIGELRRFIPPKKNVESMVDDLIFSLVNRLSNGGKSVTLTAMASEIPKDVKGILSAVYPTLAIIGILNTRCKKLVRQGYIKEVDIRSYVPYFSDHA